MKHEQLMWQCRVSRDRAAELQANSRRIQWQAREAVQRAAKVLARSARLRGSLSANR